MKHYISSIKTWILGLVIWALTYLMALTLRYTFKGKETFDKFISKNPTVAVFWHGEFFLLPYLYRKQKVATFVSPSKDGNISNAVLRRYKFGRIRGSSTRGGVSASREAINYIKNGYAIGITADGPRGPYHKLKPGAVWIAQQMNIPVVPVTVRLKNSLKLGSWDKFAIPVPFTKVIVIYGELIDIKTKSRQEAVEVVQKKLEEQGKEADLTIENL